MNINQNVVKSISEPLTIEGTTAAPKKFTLGEIRGRVTIALTNPLDQKLLVNEETLEKYVSEVETKMRDLGRIKKEKSDYNFAQSLLAYRVLNPKVDNALVQSLYNDGKWSIELTKDEHKAWIECVNKPNETRKTWTLAKGEGECSYSSNFGTIK
tara:strand:+ start:995 stop:1459 length:465 start_codon:yes stop_codon:yes gene_type:complete